MEGDLCILFRDNKNIYFLLKPIILSHLKLNFNNQVINKNLDQVKEVTELEFWRYYLQFMNIRLPYLTDRELDVLSYAIAGDEYKSHFKGKEGEYIRSKLKIGASFLTKIKNSLVTKGFLKETGVVRGDVLLEPRLRKFQMFVKKQLKEGNFQVTIFHPFKIKD